MNDAKWFDTWPACSGNCGQGRRGCDCPADVVDAPPVGVFTWFVCGVAIVAAAGVLVTLWDRFGIRMGWIG